MRALAICLIFSTALFAEVLSLKPGESRIFKINGVISTVFASEPKILDYKLINPNTLAVYSRAPGYGEIKVLGGSNGDRVLLDIKANVDAENQNFERIAKIIQDQNPGSEVKIERLTVGSGIATGPKGYIITGTVPSEEARDNAYSTAAIALGLTPKREATRRRDTVVTSQQGVSLDQGASSGGVENLDFLERYTVDGLIDALKINEQRQVNVKLIVADVEKSLVDKLGIDFNSGTFVIPIISPNRSGYNLVATIEAIKDDQIAKILATPNISVLSGQSASFQVVSQFTPISNTVTITGQAVASPQTPVDFGVSLTVQPKIYSKDRIVLNISQEVSNIQSLVAVNGASSANLRKRRTSSVIELADGDSFVLGGLIDEHDIESVKAIPFLGDIPYLGAIFKRSTITRSKTELIVIATVTLTKPVAKETVKIPTFDMRTLQASLFNISGVRVSEQENKDFMNFMANIGFEK